MNKKSAIIASRKLSRKTEDLEGNSDTDAEFVYGSLSVESGLKMKFCGGSTRQESRRTGSLPRGTDVRCVRSRDGSIRLG